MIITEYNCLKRKQWHVSLLRKRLNIRKILHCSLWILNQCPGLWDDRPQTSHLFCMLILTVILMNFMVSNTIHTLVTHKYPSLSSPHCDLQIWQRKRPLHNCRWPQRQLEDGDVHNSYLLLLIPQPPHLSRWQPHPSQWLNQKPWHHPHHPTATTLV